MTINASPAPSIAALASTVRDPADLLSENELEQIKDTAREFEALVLSQFLAPLFADVDQGGLTGNGPGHGAYQAMMQEHYANAIADRGGFGIADQIQASLIRFQAASA